MTLVVALGAYFLILPTQGCIYSAVRSSPAEIDGLVEIVVFFPIVLLIGYLAERVRRGTSTMLGMLLLLTIAAQIVWWDAGNAPVQTQLAWLVLGPTVILIGVVTNRSRSSAG
jgi:hypothetical protein